MIVQIQKNATEQEIRVAVERITQKNKKIKKGYPDLNKFSGIIESKDFVAIQKQIRDEWE